MTSLSQTEPARNPIRQPDRRGFTLLEMMLALVLFAGGILAAMELFSKGQAGITDGENVLIATHLAHRCLEELRNKPFADLSASTCSPPSGFSRFTDATTITAPYTHLRQIVVTVSWVAPGGGQADVTLQTYRSAS